MRDYDVMRAVLLRVRDRSGLPFAGFADFSDRRAVVSELTRLRREGLVRSTVEFDAAGVCLGGRVEGLTARGEDFARLIEPDGVWSLCLRTLVASDVDLSYPLLERVCEAVVERYVLGFVPEP